MGDRGNIAVRAGSVFAALLATLSISGGVALAAAWGPSFPVTPAAIEDFGAQEATVLADDEGNFTYLWLQKRGVDNFSLNSSAVRADGGARNTFEVTTTNADGTPTDIEASTGPDGIVHLTFVRTETTCTPICNYNQKLQYLPLGPDGTPLAPEQTIDSTTPGSGDYFSTREIATGPLGHTRLAWTRQDVSEFEGVLKTAFSPPGESFAAPVTIPVDGSALSPTVEVDSSGEAVIGVTYEKNNSPDPVTSGFLARSVSPADALGLEKTIVQESTDSVASPMSGMDGNGKITFAFRQTEGFADRVFFRQMDSEGTVLEANPTPVSDPDALSADIQPPFGLDVSEDGTVALAWREFNSDSSVDEAWMRTVSPDGTPGTPSQLSAPGETARLPAVALSPAGGGTGLVSYFDNDESVAVIDARSFDATGVPTGPAVRLDEAAGPNDSADLAGLSFDGKGDAVGLWGFEIDAQDSEDEFWSSILDATAPEVEIWTPAKATAGLGIVVAADARDRSALNIEWTFGDGGTASGAFAEHTYDDPGTFEIELVATDSAGNETTSNSSIEILPAFVQPPIAPDTRITARPKKRSRAATATFRFTSTLAGSSFECRLDRAGWSNCRSPRRLRKLKPGKHTFRVRAIRSGLIDRTPASFSWTVKK
jgi:hypothetical protein